MIGRRGFITGLISFVAAPAIVRAGSLMPVKMMPIEPYGVGPAMQAHDLLEEYLEQMRATMMIPGHVMRDLGTFGHATWDIKLQDNGLWKRVR